MVVRNGRKLGTPFLDISSQVTSGGEQGLLSMAFAPDYASSGRFYVYFTDGDGDQRVVEYRRASANRADPGSARLVLAMPDSESNHNGGLLLFGPGGHLYIGTGDGGGAGDRHGARGNAQNLGSLLGKILRIDPRPSGGRGLLGAALEPVRRPLRRARRDLRLRAAQPVALLVRPPQRRPLDRRRRPERGRGDRLRALRPRQELRLAPVRGPPPLRRPASPRPATCGRCSSASTATATARSPAASSSATAPCPRSTAATCSATSAAAGSSRRRLRPGGATRQRTTRLNVPNLSSFGEDARGRVYAVSLDGPVYRHRRPALMAELADHDIARLRADNPSPYTLDGTNTWVIGRDPAWVVDPGPALDAHLDAVAAEVAAPRRRGRDRAHARPRGPRRGRRRAARAARRPAGRRRAPPGRRRARRRRRVRAAARGRDPGPRRRPPRVRRGRRRLHRRRRAGRGQRLRDRAGSASTWPRSSACDALGLEVLCPGHGPPVWDPAAKLGEYLAHRAERERKLLAALDAGARTEDELLDAAWADAPAALRPAAALTLRAHAGKLADEGRLPDDVQLA